MLSSKDGIVVSTTDMPQDFFITWAKARRSYALPSVELGLVFTIVSLAQNTPRRAL